MIEAFKILKGHDKVRADGTCLGWEENQPRTGGHMKLAKLTK